MVTLRLVAYRDLFSIIMIMIKPSRLDCAGTNQLNLLRPLGQ